LFASKLVNSLEELAAILRLLVDLVEGVVEQLNLLFIGRSFAALVEFSSTNVVYDLVFTRCNKQSWQRMLVSKVYAIFHCIHHSVADTCCNDRKGSSIKVAQLPPVSFVVTDPLGLHVRVDGNFLQSLLKIKKVLTSPIQLSPTIKRRLKMPCFCWGQNSKKGAP